jgi:hypothetical protein
VDDWRKLKHLIEYLKSTCDLPLVLSALNTGVLHWHVDVSFATHPAMRGHTGGVLTMGTGCPLVTSTKQKCNVPSSTVGELVAVDEMIGQILWTWLFMLAQGIKVTDNILYQDNKVQYFWRQMDRRPVPNEQSISRFGITMLRIVLPREICQCLVSYQEDDCRLPH